ncbi:protein WEAK CHLOROPLAST MOVEMENT UNDER BLUE LIGHT 1 [Cocos nucifera]|uniref:Protein WEAK CHLOROPLAST MOVEMENT UNDER BLUE LIGHT 1 n=1 Tax=Cocos nucifera TaxID=13894 RepID=A0A8K0I9D7_COCNU|nr:protein WEAK CHLOROPLAST MOVEMENT UNDER BLUE LIGHT 1 [Cocos nucifera]
MLRRCIWKLSSGESIKRNPRTTMAQMPFFLSSRYEYSNASHQSSTQRPAPAKQTPNSGNHISKIVLGSVVVGAAVITAYKIGFEDIKLPDKLSSPNSSKLNNVRTSESLEHSAEQKVLPNNEKLNMLKPDMEIVEKHDEPGHFKDSDIKREVPEIAPAEEPLVAKRNESVSLSQEAASILGGQSVDSEIQHEDIQNIGKHMAQTEANVEQKTSEASVEQNAEIGSSVDVLKETATNEVASDHDTSSEMPKNSLNAETEAPTPLSQSYSLQDEVNPDISRREKGADALAMFSKNKEASVATSEKPEDKKTSEDGKIILDLIDAIHSAEKKQAESDAYIFAEEKRKLKEKYEKDLKDARARELMYAEEAAILEKELNREKAKAAATIKSLQEKAEQNLREELKHKDEETDIKLKKVQELANAELAAAISKEKASQIEKIAEADLNINALCMAFYARSEEARQTHSVHKLALGTLALEDALSKGLPIQAEVAALRKSLEGIDKESLLDLALTSLPDEILNYGSCTQMQLNQKFDSLKRNLRHFSLIPAGGGGILTHAVAHFASSIKMKEGECGDGIESVISKVENFLLEGKLAEAADALGGGVRGSQAEEIVIEWVRQATNRAIAEQALSLLQSYATSITFA